MDKRTQLAVLLIALILGANLTFTAYVQKKRAQAAKAQQQQIADSLAAHPAPIATGPDAKTPPAGATPQAAGATPQAAGAGTTPGRALSNATFAPATGNEPDIVIETPLQRLRIARAGALVREITLPKFGLYSGGLVDLVPAGARGDIDRVSLGLSLKTPQGDVGLDGARFDPVEAVPDNGSIQLAAGGGAPMITMRCPAPSRGA